MVMVRAHVAKQYRCGVERVDHDIDFAVVEKISEGRASAGSNYGKPCALDWRNQLELLAVQIVVEQRALGKTCTPILFVDLRIDMAIDPHDVFPAIIVVSDEAGSPAEKGNSVLGEAEAIGQIGEVGVCVI